MIKLIELNEDLPSNGGNQLFWTSICESKKMMTSPVAFFAPVILAFIKPWRPTFSTNTTLSPKNSLT